jgi:hypothetical protein
MAKRKKPEEFSFETRKWLNTEKHGGSAFVTSEIDSWSAYFKIGDCNRIVTLDFSFYNLTEYRNSKHKLNVLIRELNRFSKELEKARKSQQERKKKERQNKK